MSRSLLAVLPLAAALLAACEGPQRPGRKPPSRFESELSKREKALDSARAKLLEAARRADPHATDLPSPVKELAGVEATKAEIQKMRDAVAKLVVTDLDIEGLNAYCAGDAATAREKFRASDARQPGREFPLYFLAAQALHDSDVARAREGFAKVAALNPQCRSAVLLGHLARLCAGRKRLDATQFLILFDQASRETLKALSLEKFAQTPSLAHAFVPPLASDPVLFKCQELLGDIVKRDFWQLADAYAEGDSPEARLGIVLQMGDNVLADALVQSLAQDHPTHKDIRTFAFLHRYYARSPKSRDGFAAELAAVEKLDGDNGALALLSIPERAGGEAPPKPLTEAEAALLRKAARAKEFTTFAAWRRDERRAAHARRYGPFASCVPMTRMPDLYAHLAEVGRRGAASVAALLAEGKTDEALKLASDIEALAARADDEAKDARSQLLADTVLDALYQAMQAHAVKADLKPLLKTCVERRAEICAHSLGRMLAWDLNLVTLFRMPVRCLVDTAALLESSPDQIRRFSVQKLHANPEKYFQEAVGRLAAVDDGHVPSDACEQVLILAELKDRNAVPLLIRLAGHPNPLLAHLATRAFSTIAEGKK